MLAERKCTYGKKVVHVEFPDSAGGFPRRRRRCSRGAALAAGGRRHATAAAHGRRGRRRATRRRRRGRRSGAAATGGGRTGRDGRQRVHVATAVHVHVSAAAGYVGPAAARRHVGAVLVPRRPVLVAVAFSWRHARSPGRRETVGVAD